MESKIKSKHPVESDINITKVKAIAEKSKVDILKKIE